ncbi:probable DNA-directed RNA polymerase subunit delta [Phymastichus coffea]|uniref:probable DNA-directed RNA polymerase subunit delta n=1 Tax=Phymastichus coffea TaxID=108790 RepID=UPI00273AA425|nr:probable DNA-directed RNA polymerase subunit delta [Phymastichus coffea]
MIHVCDRLTQENGNVEDKTNNKLVNNTICHLFKEIRYEINTIEIDKVKNVGLTSLRRNSLSLNPSQSLIAENASWTSDKEVSLINDEGYFDVTLPLIMLIRFAEDYRKIVVNVKHELMITISKNDLNTTITLLTDKNEVITYEKIKITLNKFEWLMPYVVAADRDIIKLLNQISRDRVITMSYRTWESYEYTKLPRTSKHVWSVKTPNQLEKPRFINLAFQTQRKNKVAASASHFDHCNICDVKLFLNSQCYPYRNLNFPVDVAVDDDDDVAVDDDDDVAGDDVDVADDNNDDDNVTDTDDDVDVIEDGSS